MKKRTWHYIQLPQEYEITCDKCGGTNLAWSEYEGKVWCYSCLIDTKGTEGVFEGPIPIECAAILGMTFDRWDMVNKCVLTHDKKTQKYIPKVFPKRVKNSVAQCNEECWYLYPQRLTNGEGYRCHCRSSCPAWCENCKHDCKNAKDPWCTKFELKKDK